MSRKKELVTKTAIISVGKLFTQVLSFLLLPLYTNILSPEEYGIYDLVVTISAFLVPCITLLLEEAMFRFLIDAENKNEKVKIISNCTCIIFLNCIIVCFLLSIITIITGNIFYLSLLLYAVSTSLLNIGSAISRGSGNIKLYSIVNLLVGGFSLAINVILICFTKLGYTSLIYSYGIMNIIGFCIFSISNKLHRFISFKYFNIAFIRELFKYSIPLVPNTVCWSVINLSDRLLITFFLGTSVNGIYSISTKFPHIITLIFGFFYTAWLEVSSKIVKESNSEKQYVDIYQIVFSILISLTLCMLSILPICYNWLVGLEYQSGYNYITLLLLSALFNNLASFFGGIYVANKKTKLLGYTTLLGAIVNLLVDLLLMKRIGLLAAALSTLTSTFVIFAIRRFNLRKELRLPFQLKIIDIFVLLLTIISFYCNINLVNYVVLIICIVYLLYRNKAIIKEVLILLSNKKRSNDE